MPEDRPGFLDATGVMEQLTKVQDASQAEIERVRRVYLEIERRDGAANWHAALWFRFACLLAVVLIVCISAVVYFAMQASKIAVFVQPVQVTEDGKMVLVGIPVDLLSYEPSNGQEMDMLASWVTNSRWRSGDQVLERSMWAWLYSHTCGEASKFLARDETETQPFKVSKARSSIDIKSITKTDTPKSYQVLWHEVTLDSGGSAMIQYDYTGTFTLARKRPKTLDEAKDNHLGICVNGYSLSRKQTS
jgi:type IV secretory pathway TrbF-like protein